MAFGGFFGGGSSSGSDKSSSSSSSSSSSEAPSAQAVFQPDVYPSASSGSSSSEIKNKLTNALATQSNILNAKILIQKINENCFDHCIPSPGSSLSKAENQCLSSCMEKYIDGWNVVSRTYVGRLQREGAQLGLSGGL